VANRSYGQHCAIAKALDLVGDRWTLLIVRELVGGPKRYVDLQAGLPGIATDMLAGRLRDLEAEGLVTRRTLPPPAASKVYELTGRGRELQPVLSELARFGLPLIGAKRRDDVFRVEWFAAPLQLMFDADRAAGVELTVQFNIGRDKLHAIISGGALSTVTGPAGDPDVVVTATVPTLARVAGEPGALADLVASGKLQVAGADDAIDALLWVLSLAGDRTRTGLGFSK
jgi:DNA-binding HxlR family transcriptional regulator